MLIFPTQTFKLETLEFIVFNCRLQFQVAHKAKCVYDRNSWNRGYSDQKGGAIQITKWFDLLLIRLMT